MKGKGGQITAAAAAAAAATTSTGIGSISYILTHRKNQIGTCRRNDARAGTGASIIHACSALSIISRFLLCAFGTCDNCIPIQQFQMHQYVISKE